LRICHTGVGAHVRLPFFIGNLGRHDKSAMNLITWNVNKRKAVDRQMAALIERSPDMIALQEVSLSTLPRWREALTEWGYPHVVDSYHDGHMPRRSFVMTGSRYPLVARETTGIAWAQGIVSAWVETPAGVVDVTNVHVPSIGRYQYELKAGFMEGVFSRVARHGDYPRVLCGDFNSPQMETSGGEVITFCQTRRADGTWKVMRGWERMHQAERNLLVGLDAFGMVDAYRAVHGYEKQDSSWYAKSKGRLFGFRLDHVIASRSLKPTRFEYLHEWRDTNLSDHAAADVTFSFL